MCVLDIKNKLWSLQPLHHLLLPLCLLGATTACVGGRLTQREMHRAYQQALASTETTARSDWQAHPDALAAAVDRLKRYFREMTRTNVERLTKLTYAQDAFLFCDMSRATVTSVIRFSTKGVYQGFQYAGQCLILNGSRYSARQQTLKLASALQQFAVSVTTRHPLGTFGSDQHKHLYRTCAANHSGSCSAPYRKSPAPSRAGREAPTARRHWQTSWDRARR